VGNYPYFSINMTLNKDTFTGEYQYSLDSKGRVNIPAIQAIFIKKESKYFCSYKRARSLHMGIPHHRVEKN